MFIQHRLAVLFHCAHISNSHYSSFGLMGALDTLKTVLNSSDAQTRLLTRLVICCLQSIMEDHHYSLLELTEEEIDLLLRYIRQPAQFCELDPAKFLKAASVLFRKVPPQSISVRLLTEITQSVINLLQKDFDNTIMESVIYLLWTLCHVPEIKNSTSKVESLTLKLMSLQESSCSIVSSPARSLLWQLGHGSYEGAVYI